MKLFLQSNSRPLAMSATRSSRKTVQKINRLQRLTKTLSRDPSWSQQRNEVGECFDPSVVEVKRAWSNRATRDRATELTVKGAWRLSACHGFLGCLATIDGAVLFLLPGAEFASNSARVPYDRRSCAPYRCWLRCRDAGVGRYRASVIVAPLKCPE